MQRAIRADLDDGADLSGEDDGRDGPDDDRAEDP